MYCRPQSRLGLYDLGVFYSLNDSMILKDLVQHSHLLPSSMEVQTWMKARLEEERKEQIFGKFPLEVEISFRSRTVWKNC